MSHLLPVGSLVGGTSQFSIGSSAVKNFNCTFTVWPTLLACGFTDCCLWQAAQSKQRTQLATRPFRHCYILPEGGFLSLTVDADNAGVALHHGYRQMERDSFWGFFAELTKVVREKSMQHVDRFSAIMMIRSLEIGYGRVTGIHWRLATHPDVNVRQYLATRPADSLSCRYQEILATDPERSVRSALARCKGYVSPSALAELSLDEEPGVRATLADRSDLPLLVWNVLAADPASSVRLRVVHNTAAPAETIRILCADSLPQIRSAAQHHAHASLDGQIEVALRGEN